MRRTRHFAGVIGAAGIVVSPFMAPLAAQADDTLPTDTLDYAVEGDANLDTPEYKEDGVPNLPITRVVSPEDAVAQEASAPLEDSDEEFSMPVVSKHAAALDVVETDNGVVVLDVPDEVKENLPASGELSGDVLKGFIVEGSEAGLDGIYEFDGMNWVKVTPVAEGESDATAPQKEVVSQDVADRLNAYVAQRNAGNVVAAPRTVGVAAPVAEDVAEATDNVADDVAPAPETPQLPVTGEDAAVAPVNEESSLPMASLLGIAGLALGGGIGVVTLRRRMELSKND